MWNVGREAFAGGGEVGRIARNQGQGTGAGEVHTVQPHIGAATAAVHGHLAVGEVVGFVQRIDIQSAHIEGGVGHSSLHVVLKVADVQAHQTGHDRALDAGVFAVCIAGAIKTGRRHLHQACALVRLRTHRDRRFACGGTA